MDHKDILKYLRRAAGILPVAAMVANPSSAQAQWDEEEDTTTYRVVINHEEQYSIWPADRELPLGWNDVGKTCEKKQECLDYIEEVWTDMRPLSLRKKMEEDAARQAGVQQPQQEARFKVVYNDNDEYSIIPATQELAEGWYDTGMVGTKAECEAYVKEDQD